MEKRHCKRIDRKSNICWQTLNLDSDLEECSAEMKNYCKDGMCFLSQSDLKPRQIVCVRMDNCDGWRKNDPACREGLRYLSVAEVKWCREMVKPGQHHFGIGVKYIDKYF